MTLPKEILNKKQWTISHSLSELKRPLDSLYRPDGALTYKEAKAKAGKHKLMGFYVTPKDAYVLGDIDHIDDPMDRDYLATILSVGFCDLLFNRSLYSEASPSGKGIRFIARLASPETKKLLSGDYRKNRDPMGRDTDGTLRESQINLGRPWQTITGNKTPYSSDRISILDIDIITQLYNYNLLTTEVVGTDYRPPPPPQSSKTLPSISVITEALHSLPWDENPRLLRAFKATFKEEYTPYEYWLKVIMAVSDYASKIDNLSETMRCLEEIITWSSKDEKGYEGEEPVIKKWESLMRTESRVTYHTLLSLRHYSKLIWPQPKTLSARQIKNGVTTVGPMVAQYSNFKAMVDYYDLVLYQDSNSFHKMYLTGDQDILDHYFTHLSVTMYHGKYLGPWSIKTLIPKFHAMCQDHGYINVSSTQIIQNLNIWIGDINKAIDLVKLYFDTPYEELSEDYKMGDEDNALSNVEFLFDCLSIEPLTDNPIKENALYFKYYKSWLMGLARNIFFPNTMHMNNCVLLLTGNEQVRKTSHFKFILPKFMRQERVAFTPHGFGNESSIRDVTKLASMNNLIVWDEIEQFLSAETESNFKKLIDNNPIKIIDKYEVIDSYIKPIAIYGGTSNQREFQLSDTGSRRLFIIPVTWVDTDAMDRVNWWKIVNDLRDEIKNAPTDSPPWLLSEPELNFQAQLHSKVSSKSSLDLIIEEMFDFEEEWIMSGRKLLPGDFDFRTSSYLWTSSDISKRLKRSGLGGNFNRKHLVRVLKRLCSEWTRTQRAVRGFPQSPITIRKGEVIYNGRAKYWMPGLIKSTKQKGYFDNEFGY